MKRELLTEGQSAERLEGLQGWRIADGSLCFSSKFDSFLDAFAFISKIALLAEKANHHPKIVNEYSKVELALSTHDVGGITELDFALAKQISDL